MFRVGTLLNSLLILLFVGFSFNAYACLLPLFGDSAAVMANGCPTPEQQPTPQFCDVFKTLSVESAKALDPDDDAHRRCPAGMTFSVCHPTLASYCIRLIAQSPVDPLPCLQLRTVLRL